MVEKEIRKVMKIDYVASEAIEIRLLKKRQIIEELNNDLIEKGELLVIEERTNERTYNKLREKWYGEN